MCSVDIGVYCKAWRRLQLNTSPGEDTVIRHERILAFVYSTPSPFMGGFLGT